MSTQLLDQLPLISLQLQRNWRRSDRGGGEQQRRSRSKRNLRRSRCRRRNPLPTLMRVTLEHKAWSSKMRRKKSMMRRKPHRHASTSNQAVYLNCARSGTSPRMLAKKLWRGRTRRVPMWGKMAAPRVLLLPQPQWHHRPLLTIPLRWQ